MRLFAYTSGVRTRFQRFLLILLMLGLPLQTFAATSMIVCMSVHETLAVQQVAAEDAVASCHDSEVALPQSHDCTHCSLCVLASALPIPAAERVRALESTRDFVTCSVVRVNGFIPDGPERPPRTSLA